MTLSPAAYQGETPESVFNQLVFLMRTHRGSSGGFCVLLGAGCSLSSASEDISTPGIIRRFLQARNPAGDYAKRSFEENYREFINAWVGFGKKDRDRVLAQFIASDIKPSAGYIALARLISAGYVKSVITTNFDNLVDTALTQSGIAYTLHCGEMDPFNPSGRAPTATVVKIHGGLLQGGTLRFSPDDLERLPQRLTKTVRELSAAPLLVVGYSGLDQGVMNALSPSRDFAVFWADPRRPSRDDRARTERIFSWLDKRAPKAAPFLSGAEHGMFDRLMERLYDALEHGGVPPSGTGTFPG